MMDFLVTSSVLISTILLLRRLIRGKVSAAFQYFLWLPVVIRLCIPFPLWSNPVSVMNLFPRSEQLAAKETVLTKNIFSSSYVHNNEFSIPLGGEKHDLGAFSVQASILTIVWLTGFLLVGGYMLFYQLKWKHFLYLNRCPLQIGLDADLPEMPSCFSLDTFPNGFCYLSDNNHHNRLSVFMVKELPSPCLSGKSIYLTDKMALVKHHLTHILAHEYCHYLHGDSIWVIARCFFVAVYWFHPLVWISAFLSKQDSELACDEAVIRLLGEKERFSYGRTLLKLIADKNNSRNRIGIASTMSGKEKGIRERIFRISQKPKRFLGLTGIVFVLVCILVAATFSGRERAEGSRTASSFDVSDQDDGAVSAPASSSLPSLAETQAEISEETDILIYLNPCPSYTRISNSFGSRINPMTGKEILHEGIDLVAEEGSDVLASADGIVHQTGYDSKNGNFVTLYHPANDSYTYYSGCKEIPVSENDQISQGQKIATVGKTGSSTGAHLHFGIQKNGEFIEPVVEGID